MVNEYPTEEYMRKNKALPIIDIRTEGEWYQTGILKGSHTITFFDEMGQYDLEGFLEKLHKIIKEKEAKFLLICRTGSRTGHLAQYLGKIGYSPINLAGGIHYVMQYSSFEIVDYN
jgi:rhodanese-related sulfurtransferase